MLLSSLYTMWSIHLQNLKVLCPRVKEMHLQENTLFDLWVKVTGNVAQYPLHHLTYAYVNLEVNTSNGKGKDAFTRKYIILLWFWPLGQGHRKFCRVPFTSYDLCTCKVWSLCIRWLRRRWLYKKIVNTLFDLDPNMKCCSVPSTSCDLCTCIVCSCYAQLFSEDAFTRNRTDIYT